MTVTNSSSRPQKTTRAQPTSQKPAGTTRPRATPTQRPVDAFERTTRKAPVELKPTETAAQERARRVSELQGKLQQVMNAEPPMTEAQLRELLGAADDGNYDKAGSNQLDAETRRGLYAMMKCIHQIGRAREAVSKGDAYLASAYLDADRSDEYTGAISFRDAARFNGMTGPEVLPFARAIIDVTQRATPLLERENMTSLTAGKEIAAYFKARNEVMSQGPVTQQVLRNVVRYTQELEQAMAMPVTDGNRAEVIRIAKENLDNNVRALGPDPLKALEEGRRGTIDGLNTIGELAGSVPTPVTRAAGALMKTVANGLEYASGDIDGTQLAFKQTMVLVDAVGGQVTQKMRMLPRLVADAGLEFTKSLTGELAKIPTNASDADRRIATDKAVRTALYNTVMNVLTDIGVASMGEAGQKVATELARALTASSMGALGATGSELYKLANDPGLTPEKKAAAMKEIAWKGLTNLVKTTSEGVLEAVKNR
ncbi:MAG: hypothetical protein DI536_15280 [Archangium gephyra]|uniref:Uncharacterized protein n=1 Tax=Archangium gephyra TaxID=48 RepID=A0A2W5THZ0_9BACT|nr:MAG: hypothetical protein DI536_15280 [Archangium gephyra]